MISGSLDFDATDTKMIPRRSISLGLSFTV